MLQKDGGFQRGLSETARVFPVEYMRSSALFTREAKRVPQLPIFLQHYRKQAVGGVIYFGYFLLDKQKKVTRKSGETDKVESTPNLQFELNIRGRRNGRLNSKHIRITTIQTSHHQWRYHYQTQAKRNNCNNQQRHENEAIK